MCEYEVYTKCAFVGLHKFMWMMAFGSFLQSLNVLHVCFVIMVMSQEILQYPRIRRVGNPQIICGIVKGYPQVRQRVSAESSKGILEIIKGYPRNRQRVSADSLKGSQNQRHPQNHVK